MKKDDNNSSYNIFRDSAVRYLGYANEVGESFRYQFPRLVGPSYLLAFAYCAADAASSGYTVYQANQLYQPAAISVVDTLLWQSLASVMIPGAAINLLVKASRAAVRRVALPVLVAEWLPTGVGLGSIPFIVQPIDWSVDYALDNTTRMWYKAELER